jgi:hypothetical protein
MQYFYDGQVRRYLTQTIRVFSNFVVKYGDGTLVRVPVSYGDPDRQVASIIRQNSENKINSVPKIAVYISELSLDRSRLADSSYVGKLHFRERDTQIDPDTGKETYNQAQGRNYTVERLMPTPFKLKMKIDIWTGSTEQKLQLLEQILVLFNPSLELQTTDNYVDWTSLTLLDLTDVRWSSRTVPMGTDAAGAIDIATLTVETPIWISPPAKVKHLGVITRIITSFYQDVNSNTTGYIDGLGDDLATPTVDMSNGLGKIYTTNNDYGVQVYKDPTPNSQYYQVRLLGKTEGVMPAKPTLEITIKQGPAINWEEFLNQYPGKYVAGSSRIQLFQQNGSVVVGTIVVNALDKTLLTVDFDPATYPSNTDLGGLGDYISIRTTPGNFDMIIDPLRKGPRGHGLVDPVNGSNTLRPGTRYLIVEDIGNPNNTDGADAWKHTTAQPIPGTSPVQYTYDFVAKANDIIEWDGEAWHIVLDSTQESDTIICQTNIYTGVQYSWDNVSWSKSFEGEYRASEWRIEL